MSYEVRLAPAAARRLRKLPPSAERPIRQALVKLGDRAAGGATGRRGGKSIKTIHGRTDRFFRLRQGDYRIMYDILDSEKTILVLGIVHRSDLDRWLRGK